MPNPLLVLNNEKVDCDISLSGIQRIFIRFLTQLRARYLFPMKIISIISSNIIALLEEIHEFAQQRSVRFITIVVNDRNYSIRWTAHWIRRLPPQSGVFLLRQKPQHIANMSLLICPDVWWIISHNMKFFFRLQATELNLAILYLSLKHYLLY